jgi:hypothetical protein
MKKLIAAYIASGMISSIFMAPSAHAIDCYKLPDSKTSKCQAYLKAAKKAGLVQTDTQEVPLAPAIAQRDAGRKVSESVKVPKTETKPSATPTTSSSPAASVSPSAAPTVAATSKGKSSKKPKAKKTTNPKSKSKITPKPKAKKSPKAKSSSKSKSKKTTKKK